MLVAQRAGHECIQVKLQTNLGWVPKMVEKVPLRQWWHLKYEVKEKTTLMKMFFKMKKHMENWKLWAKSGSWTDLNILRPMGKYVRESSIYWMISSKCMLRDIMKWSNLRLPFMSWSPMWKKNLSYMMLLLNWSKIMSSHWVSIKIWSRLVLKNSWWFVEPQSEE